jgi:NitT/TauT family transport system substrate-binding protein
VILLAGCATSGSQTPASADAVPVDLVLSFQPDVQFAPFYVGLEQGFFRAHGLDVTITHQSESDALRLVAAGQGNGGLHAAVVSGEQVLLARAQDLPVEYVYEWYQKFPVAIASRTEANIVTVADLKGHSVGVPLLEGASYIGLRALLAAGGLTESDIDLQVTGFTQVETLATNRVDAVVVYATNEPAQLAAVNVPVNLIYVSDVIDLVSNGLVVSEDAARNHPELMSALVAAFNESLQYTLDHPDTAFEDSKLYVEGLNDSANDAIQRTVLANSLEFWKADRLGFSEESSWVAMEDTLLSMGLLTDAPDVSAAFTNDFLPAP